MLLYEHIVQYCWTSRKSSASTIFHRITELLHYFLRTKLQFVGRVSWQRFSFDEGFCLLFLLCNTMQVFAPRESIEDRKRVLSVCYLPFSGSQTPALSLAWGICLRTVMGTSPSGCSSLPPPLLLVELELCSLIKHISELPPISSKISTCWPLWTVISREPGVATWSATTHVVSMELCQHKNFKTWANLF